MDKPLQGDQLINTRPLKTPSPALLAELADLVARKPQPSARPSHIEANNAHSAEIVRVATQVLREAVDEPALTDPVKLKHNFIDGHQTIWMDAGSEDWETCGKDTFTQRLAIFAEQIRHNHYVGRYADLVRACEGVQENSARHILMHPAQMPLFAAARTGASMTRTLKVLIGTPAVPWAKAKATRIHIFGQIPEAIFESLPGMALARVIELPDVLTPREREMWERLTITKAARSRKKNAKSSQLTISSTPYMPADPEPSAELAELQRRWREMASILSPV